MASQFDIIKTLLVGEYVLIPLPINKKDPEQASRVRQYLKKFSNYGWKFRVSKHEHGVLVRRIE